MRTLDAHAALRMSAPSASVPSMTTSEDPARAPEVGAFADHPEPAADDAEALAVVDDAADRQQVEEERAELRDFVKELSMDEIKSGGWFTKLLSHAMTSYTSRVDWAYFQEKYQGVPADAIVDQRIKMASGYAAIEGGLSEGAYTAAI